MGEKGNITSDELAASVTRGSGTVVAGVGTQVTAVFEEVGETVKDKLIDKGADAGIELATERLHKHQDDEGAAGKDGG